MYSKAAHGAPVLQLDQTRKFVSRNFIPKSSSFTANQLPPPPVSIMRIAIAGAGGFAKHFVPEAAAAGIEVVMLTRSHKDFFDGKAGVVEQRITDYSNASEIAKQLHDCEALVSTIQDQTEIYGQVHLVLLEACKLSTKCKRFIPSEFSGNTEDVPECKHPSYTTVRDALKAQSEIEWTVVATGWLTDFVVPSHLRVHPDAGPFCPLDITNKTLTIPGTGDELLAMTSARDCGKAVMSLLQSTTKWNNYTFIQGEQTTWNKIAEKLKTEGGMTDLKMSYQPADELLATIEANKDSNPFVAMLAGFTLITLRSLRFDQDKVQRDRELFFKDIKFRTISDAIQFAKTHEDGIF